MSSATRDRLRPLRSVRARLTLAGSATLLAGLVVGALVFAQLFERQLIESLDINLRSLANDRARSIDAGLDPETQLDTEQRETAVVVFAVDGQVLANRGFVDPAQVEGLEPGASVSRSLDYIEPDEAEVERAELRIHVARPGETTVVVATELEQVSQTVNQARGLLVVGVPLITLIGALLLWIVVGRALRPVDRMRRDAQAIAELGGEQRVHDPGSEDELGRLASTLNDMLARLDANAVSMRRFVSDSSHEIRSPIANIRARVETARPDEWSEARGDVIGEVERIETIIDDLTYLARSDEGRTERSIDRVELDGILFAEAARLQRNGRVTVDASDVEPIVINADHGQIQRAVRNLVDNAERHADSKVRVAVTSLEGHVVIDIDDDGPGVPPSERDRVFERFVRLDESRQRASGGTGLGLAIVEGIIADHGGGVQVLESPLGGARLRLLLPFV